MPEGLALHVDSIREAAESYANGAYLEAAETLKPLITEHPRAAYSYGLALFAGGEEPRGQGMIAKRAEETPGMLPLFPMAGHEGLFDAVARRMERSGTTLNARLTVQLAAAIALDEAGRHEDAAKRFIDIIRKARGNGEDRLPPASMTADEVRKAAQGQPIWHSIDLGNTFIQGRRKTSRILAGEVLRMRMPEVKGKSVLDIGAWGGFFSFEAERRGAASVLAVDWHTWITDFQKIHEWVHQERDAGRIPDTYNPPAYTQDKEALPGKIPFDVTCRALGSKVKSKCANFVETPAEALGTFDVVLFLGVLYHLTEPYEALVKVRALTKECAIIETHGSIYPGLEDKPLWTFYADDKINQDKTTWWGPNDKGLEDMLYAAGFSRVEVLPSNSVAPLTHLDRPRSGRIWARAWV